MKTTYATLLIFLLALTSSGYSQTAIDYHYKGVRKWIKGDFAGAIVDLNKAIKLNPKFAQSYESRGDAKSGLKDYAGAIIDYTQAIKLAPADSETAYYMRAYALFYLDEILKAISDCNKAIEIRPKYAEVYYFRGLLKAMLYRKDSACLDFKKAAEFGYAKATIAVKENCQ